MHINRTTLINVPDKKQPGSRGQIGHRKSLNNEVKSLMYGNGCWKHPADPNKRMIDTGCFTCPEKDCIHNVTNRDVKHYKENR